MDKINKGVELMLRRKRRREPPEEPKFIIKVGKMVSIFRKELAIYFEFSLDLRDKHRGD